MEKSKAHYPLPVIRSIVAAGGMAVFTQTARINSVLMGLTSDQSLAVIASLKTAMFFKSMTTTNDHHVWRVRLKVMWNLIPSPQRGEG
ncbi:MAG: type II toxin-antitoxin system MqsR family toxin [Rhodoferax sp.]|nr:type II toxin-antitoxin system MqsR family toxin [Rhodoferax sp.]